MRYKFFLSLIIIGSIIAGSFPVSAGLRAEIAPQVWQDMGTSGQEIELLVNLRSQADVTAVAAAARAAGIDPAVWVVEALKKTAMKSQASLIAELDSSGIPYRAYWITNLVKVRGDQALLLRLASRPEVASIESNRSFRNDLETADPAADTARAAQAVSALPWGIDKVNAPAVWNLGISGQGIVVASGDTGVQWDHPALKANYRGWDGSTADHNANWWDAIHASEWTFASNCPPDQTAPCDDYGHGTHTTGTMVGDDGLDNKIGVAPGAKWIGCRNMNGGVGKPTTYIECLQFFMAPWAQGSTSPYAGDPTLHASIINNSYGCPPSEGCATDSLNAAVVAVRAAGIFMAVSAGNKGSGCSSVIDPPGIYQDVFSAGATDSSNFIAGFSSRGPVTVDGSNRRKPDLSAPGVSVRSSSLGASYSFLSGTSMASPHIAGAVALLWSGYPPLRGDIDGTINLLQSSATPLTTNQGCGGDTPTSVPNNVYGYGLLNTWAALQQKMPGRLFIPIVANP